MPGDEGEINFIYSRSRRDAMETIHAMIQSKTLTQIHTGLRDPRRSFPCRRNRRDEQTSSPHEIGASG